MATTNPKPQLLDKYSLGFSKVLQVQCLYPIPLEGIESMWYIPSTPPYGTCFSSTTQSIVFSVTFYLEVHNTIHNYLLFISYSPTIGCLEIIGY